MCGISGIINFNNKPVQENLVLEMMKTIKHRGPDDDGVFIDNNVGFGFVRLSIIDLSSSGHQPMFDETGRFMIIHNGEVYNYIELRSELRKKGYHFKSNTDSEVILKSYIEWGEDCLHKFNGMWAFVIYDKKTKEIFISRDRYGIKPFYYYSDKNKFIFASEIPAILQVLNKKPKINDLAIFEYLVFNRTDQTENTFFNGIKKIQHGYRIKIKLNENKEHNFDVKRWYDLKERVKLVAGFKNAQEFREVFSSAVGLRLRSDVPVGVCLSGGLDSSSITASIVRDHYKKDIKTFSVVYGDDIPTDESEYIKLFNNQVEKQFYNKINVYSFLDNIEEFVTAMGEPVPSGGPFAQFLVMKLAQNNVVVLLDGQGGDEILAGYKYFWGYYYKELIEKFKFLKFLKEFNNNSSKTFHLRTLMYYWLSPKLRTKLSNKSKIFLNQEFVNQFINASTIAEDLYSAKGLNEALFNHIDFKLEHLLKWEDRNSMWFSLESRVPFLDYRLVENTLKTEPEKLLKNGINKYILRLAMKDILPKEIFNRKDKIGFGAPQDLWFRSPIVYKKIINSIKDNEIFLREYYDIKKINKTIQEHIVGNKDYSNDIWKIYNLCLWYEKYII
jgi:asparagine synthase (glutamine-hydrolysing)